MDQQRLAVDTRVSLLAVGLALVLMACSQVSKPTTTSFPPATTEVLEWTGADYSRALDYCLELLDEEGCPILVSTFRDTGRCDPTRVDIATAGFATALDRREFALINTRGTDESILRVLYPGQEWGYDMIIFEKKEKVQGDLDRAMESAGCDSTLSLFDD